MAGQPHLPFAVQTRKPNAETEEGRRGPDEPGQAGSRAAAAGRAHPVQGPSCPPPPGRAADLAAFPRLQTTAT